MYLNRIQISNLRAIRDLSLDFGSGSSTRRWTVLLGENGCGKSTVLKAIGLILAGSDALSQLIDDVDAWIHNDADIAIIRAQISTAQGDTRDLLLQLKRGDSRDVVIRRNASGLKALDQAVAKAQRNYFIAGYGAFRRPPDPEQSFKSRKGGRVNRAANVGTLFSASTELMGLEQWAVELDYVEGHKGRELIAQALRTLLPGMEFRDIDKRTRRIMMSTRDGDVPLGHLSEGYQAMAAWAGDILYRMTEMFGSWQNPLDARGVLLIDEMDLHLHPVWKRHFVDFLNQAFPRLQIIATTHSPLSIQQCGEGELYVVKRDGELPPKLLAFNGDPSKLRLSELFLSPLIGLDTLDSPRVASLRSEARQIELRPGRRTSEEKNRLNAIAAELQGTTPLPAAEAPALAPAMVVQEALRELLPNLLKDGRTLARARARPAPSQAQSAAAVPGSPARDEKPPRTGVTRRKTAAKPEAKTATVRTAAGKSAAKKRA